jgi:hypothetical protein
MLSRDVLIESYGRIHGVVHQVIDDASPEQLSYRVDPDANTIAWLIWHLSRVQDDHIADVAGHEQLWTASGWVERFGLPFSRAATGYGQGTADVAAVQVDRELLGGYFDDVHEHTVAYLGRLHDSDLERVVDTNWNPAVTLGVRLISVLSDDLQHAGQAAYAKGIATRAAA